MAKKKQMDLSGSITNCLVHHTNDVLNTVEDERDFLRIWRRRLRDAVADENIRLLRFLRSHAEVTDAEFLERIREFPPNSGWFSRHIQNNVFDLSGVLADLDSRLGIPYTDLRRANHTAFQMYASVVRKLFDCEDALNTKLAAIHELQTRLEGLVISDLSGSEASELQTAIINYVRGVYRSHAIDTAYKEFMTCYAEWHALRGIVLGQHVGAAEVTAGPLCSICTTNKISCALVPCGHTFCNNCAMRQRHLCYVCRSFVRERMRVYFV